MYGCKGHLMAIIIIFTITIINTIIVISLYILYSQDIGGVRTV